MNAIFAFLSSLFGFATKAVDSHASATTQLVLNEASSLVATTGAELITNELSSHGLSADAVASSASNIVTGITDLVQSVKAPAAAVTVAGAAASAAPSTATPTT